MKTDKTRIPLTTVPQAPQLLGSVFGSVQTPSHSTWPGGHAGSWQRPAVQTSPSSHWWTVIYVYISMTGRRTYHIAAPPAVCRIIEDILTHSITALPVRWALVTSPKHRCFEDEAIAWICCLPQYRMPRKRRGMSGHGCRRRCSRHHPEDTAGKKERRLDSIHHGSRSADIPQFRNLRSCWDRWPDQHRPRCIPSPGAGR